MTDKIPWSSHQYITLQPIFEELPGERILIRPYQIEDAQELQAAIEEPRDDLDLEFMRSALEEAISLTRLLGEHFIPFIAIHAMGDMFRWRGEFEKAILWYFESLEIARRISLQSLETSSRRLSPANADRQP